jgi:CTP:molybdopterin cytidylyltransferase MocA
VVYVVLAAGESARMGFDKAVRALGETAPLERIALVLSGRSTIVVVPRRLQQIASQMMPRATVVVNDEPLRGMTHSLRIGLGCIDPGRAFGVLLGDMPAITETTLVRTEALLTGNVDVAFPVAADGAPGHPVLFSPRVRRVIESLADGDTLRRARDDASLVRATWTCSDASAFLDLDVPAQWEAFGA